MTSWFAHSDLDRRSQRQPGAVRPVVAALLALSLFSGAVLAAGPGDRFTIIRAKKAITVSGDEVDNAVVVISNGKIENIGPSLDFPANSRVIDARDRVIMPGLVNAATRFNLPRFSRREVHANWLAKDEFLPHAQDLLPFARAGVTTGAIYPSSGGGGVPGRALIVSPASSKAGEPRILRDKSYLYVTAEKREWREALEKAKKEIEKVDKAKAAFDEQQKKAAPASAPASAPAAPGNASAPAGAPASAPVTQPAASQPAFQPPPIAPELQPLVDLLQKKADFKIVIEVENATEVLGFEQVNEKYELKAAYVARFFVQTDLFQAVKTLGDAKRQIAIPVRLNIMPETENRYSLAAELSKAGAEVSILPVSDDEASFADLWDDLRTQVANGWPKEDALKSVTLNPAKLLGLDEQLGTMQKERAADILFLDADPFAPGARVREVMIGGEMVIPRKRGH